MKVRLYHLAAEWEVPATAILETLHENGHRSLKNHFVEVDEYDIPGLQQMLYDAGLFGSDAEGGEGAEGEDGAVAEADAGEAEVAVADAPEAVEAPQVEAPKVEEPKVEAPKVAVEAEPEAVETVPTKKKPTKKTTKKTAKTKDPVAVEVPKVEEPKVEEPKVEAPKVEEPKVEAPKVEAPAAVAAGPAEGTEPEAKAKPEKRSLLPPRSGNGPKPPPGAPAGVAAGFRGFAPGFDPNAQRSRRSGPPPRSGPGASGPGGPDLEPPGVGGRMTGDPLDPDRNKRAGSRAGLEANKRARTAARRPGAHGGQGRGRRLERRMQEMDRWVRNKRKPRGRKSRSSGSVSRPDEVQIQLPISLKDLSAELAIRVTELVKFLMKQGNMISMTMPVPVEAIEMIGLNWNIDIEIVDEILAEDTVTTMDKEEDEDKDLEPRQAVVAVLGHVDHGKTSLLDYIRKMKKPVTASEAGGITQHTGAYVAVHNKKPITFIDTPGHAAFTEMRARGANVTDIVLLVVAADDGVMPQTKEAIQHAQAAGAQIIVACNKIDKKGTDTEKVMTGLSLIDGMLPSEYGGEIDVIPCSATTGKGVDDLLESILVHAEVLELKANPKKAARGTVLEAEKTVGRGIVVTLLVEDGTLKKGDTIICGRTGGKIRRMTNDQGKSVDKTLPGQPIEVIGIDDVPDAGDRFYIVDDSEAKSILAERKERALKAKATTGMDHIPTDQAAIWGILAEQEVKEVVVVLKADVSGSLQVLKRELSNLSTEEVRCKVIRDGVGGISTADVLLATADNALVVGFGVSADGQARRLAKERGVDIRTYRIIYELIDGVKEVMAGQLDPEERENVIGQVSVRRVFKSSKVGNIAGCFVDQGIVRRKAQIRLVRDGIILWQGPMDSLRRFSEDVKEVRENFECGIKLRGYEDIKDADVFEVVEIEQIARTLD